MPGDMVLFDLATFLNGFGPWAPPNQNGSPALYGPIPGALGLYDLLAEPRWGNRPVFFPSGISLRDAVCSLLYPNGDPTYHHVATVVEEVPVDLRSNMGVQMLPSCAWFQVEFLMPEDPRNSLDYASDPSVAAKSRRSDMPRWTQVQADKTYLFVPDTEANRDLVAGKLISRDQPGMELAEEMVGALESFVTAIPM